MRRNVSMLIVASFATAIAVCFLARREPLPVSRSASISFQGYSNSPSGKAYALFVLTNDDTCDLQFISEAAVDFSEDQGLTNGRVPDVDVFYSLAGSNLCRGQSYSMFTEVPEHREKWRVEWRLERHSLTTRLVSLTERIPLVPSYNNGAPDLVYLSTDWIP
jgi:hypothetical protein